MNTNLATDPDLDTELLPLTVQFEQFVSAEAAIISGLTEARLRAYRFRGFIRTQPERAQFDLFALAWIFALGVLGERCGGPKAVIVPAKTLALSIAWHALAWREAYAGELDQIALTPEIEAMIEEHAAASAMLRKPGLTEAEVRAEVERIGPGTGFNAATKSDLVRREIFRIGQMAGDRPRYFCWWPDGTHTAHADLAEAFAGGTWETRYASSVVVCDCEALGGQLVDRAGRPFVHVSFGASPT